MFRLLALVPLLALHVLAVHGAENESVEVAAARQQQTTAVEALQKQAVERQAALRKWYGTALEALKKDAQSKGDLDTILALRAEAERAERDLTPAEKNSLTPTLLAVRNQYDGARAQQADQQVKARAAAMRAYITQLEGLEKRLTQKGDLTAALAARKEKTTAVEEMVSVAMNATPPPATPTATPSVAASTMPSSLPPLPPPAAAPAPVPAPSTSTPPLALGSPASGSGSSRFFGIPVEAGGAGAPAATAPPLSPPAAGTADLTVEGYIDGPSTLHVTADGIYWVNGDNAKPGKQDKRDEPTYVNGQPWMPVWQKPGNRGKDRTNTYPLKLGTINWEFKLVAVTKQQGASGIEKRKEIVARIEDGEYVVRIGDPEPAARWYRFELRRGK